MFLLWMDESHDAKIGVYECVWDDWVGHILCEFTPHSRTDTPSLSRGGRHCLRRHVFFCIIIHH
jgi:hypothetical protein